MGKRTEGGESEFAHCPTLRGQQGGRRIGICPLPKMCGYRCWPVRCKVGRSAASHPAAPRPYDKTRSPHVRTCSPAVRTRSGPRHFSEVRLDRPVVAGYKGARTNVSDIRAQTKTGVSRRGEGSHERPNDWPAGPVTGPDHAASRRPASSPYQHCQVVLPLRQAARGKSRQCVAHPARRRPAVPDPRWVRCWTG